MSFDPSSVPEPVELTAWAEERAAAKAEEELRNSAICGACGKRRDDEDHALTASRLRPRCFFVEPSS